MPRVRIVSRVFENAGMPVGRIIVRLVPNDADFSGGLPLGNGNPDVVEFYDPRFDTRKLGGGLSGRKMGAITRDDLSRLARDGSGIRLHPRIPDWSLSAEGVRHAADAIGAATSDPDSP